MNENLEGKSQKDDFSGVIAPLYKCSKCGEVWHVHLVEDIDTENDEIYSWHVCSYCGGHVTPILHDGIPVCHPLTAEELYWDSFSLDNEDEEYGE